jgi:chloride channel protein, CIC family
VVTRLASPAHTPEFTRGLLEKMSVADVVEPKPVVVVGEKMPLGQILEVMMHSQQNYFPVVGMDGKVTGILSITDIREVMFDESLHHLVIAKDVAPANVGRVFEEDSLQEALDKMVLLNVDELPVAKQAAPDAIIAMISKRDIFGYYHSRIRPKGLGLSS